MLDIDLMDQMNKTITLNIVAIMILTAIGCGVKGPPVAPGYTEPPVVQDVSYKVTGDRLVLSWTIPRVVGARNTRIASAGVYRLRQPMGKQDCPDCPRIFERVAKLAARSGTMTYTDSIVSGFQYYYKIILSDGANRSGGDSNIVHYIHEGNAQ